MAIVRGITWGLMVLLTLATWMSSHSRPDARLAGTVVIRDVVYRTVEGRGVGLDLYLPHASLSAARRPVAIAVHGGSWTGGSKRDYGPQFASLARRGIAVAVVDYRLARPHAPSWPGALDDLRAAVDWTTRHADERNLDVSRMFAIGTSSGGLLAARLGQSDERIQGVVCISTPYSLPDLIARRALEDEPAWDFLGRGGDIDRDADDASPARHVERSGPPMLLIHGVNDQWVSIDQAREMLKELKLHATSTPSRVIEIAGARHGFDLQVGSPSPRDLSRDVEEFILQTFRDVKVSSKSASPMFACNVCPRAAFCGSGPITACNCPIELEP